MSAPGAPEQPALDSPGATTREAAWVAREACTLIGSDDEQPRSRFLARKRALLDLTGTTGVAS